MMGRVERIRTRRVELDPIACRNEQRLFHSRFRCDLTKLSLEVARSYRQPLTHLDRCGTMREAHDDEVVQASEADVEKSGRGDADSDQRADAKKLDEDEMRLQVGLYAIAARAELEFEPERGLVRYLDPDEASAT